MVKSKVCVRCGKNMPIKRQARKCRKCRQQSIGKR